MSDETSIFGGSSSFGLLQERAANFQQAANDARSLIRTNLIIVGLFLPVISSLFSDELPLEEVFNSPYTQVGLLVWGISTFILTITYYWARRIATNQFDPIQKGVLGEIPENDQIYHIQDKITDTTRWLEYLTRSIFGCMLMSLSATTLLALGVLLPYVSIIPQVEVLHLVIGLNIAVIGLGIILYFSPYILEHIRGYRPREKGWKHLTRPRHDLFKKLYVAVGEGRFQLSDLPLKERTPMRSGTLRSTGSDESHVLLHDVNGTKISQYLLDQLVEEGYFEKEGDEEAVVVRDPYSRETMRINNAKQEIKSALDRFGRELEHNDPARECAASELGVRPEELLATLRTGNKLERVNQYNRVVERLQEEDFDISADRFKFVSDEVAYVPTDAAKNVYERLERIETRRLQERKEAEREEERRKSLNTYQYLVIEPVDEEGNLAVATNGLRAPNGEVERFNISEAQVSDEELDKLKELEKDEPIRLRIETHSQIHEDYIASVGGS